MDRVYCVERNCEEFDKPENYYSFDTPEDYFFAKYNLAKLKNNIKLLEIKDENSNTWKHLNLIAESSLKENFPPKLTYRKIEIYGINCLQLFPIKIRY